MILLDATTLIALGTVGELGLVTNFDRNLVVPEAIRAEVTTEPARTNVERFCSTEGVSTGDGFDPGDDYVSEARSILEEKAVNGDVELVAAVLSRTDAGEPVGVVSDDVRVRTVAEGLGATVTGTIGVVARAVDEGLGADEAKALVRRLDDRGLHLTGELRETAYELIEEAATDR